MAKTLYDKLWDSHVVHVEEDGTALLYIDRHLVHEVTSPQAYEGLRAAGRKPWRVESIVATADHNTPTTNWEEGIAGVRDEGAAPLCCEPFPAVARVVAAIDALVTQHQERVGRGQGKQLLCLLIATLHLPIALNH